MAVLEETLNANHNSYTQTWLSDSRGIITMLILISGGLYPVLALSTANFFGLKLLCSGLSQIELQDFFGIKVFSTVIFEVCFQKKNIYIVFGCFCDCFFGYMPLAFVVVFDISFFSFFLVFFCVIQKNVPQLIIQVFYASKASDYFKDYTALMSIMFSSLNTVSALTIYLQMRCSKYHKGVVFQGFFFYFYFYFFLF